MIAKAALLILVMMTACAAAYAQDDKQAPKQDAKGLDMVSDTVSSVFSKANALLSGNLEVTMSKDKDEARAAREFSIDATGRKVPKSTAVKSGGALHNDEPL